jgi:hypothetical protein
MLYDTISESFEALETLAKRIWKERIRRALFFATREERKKFGLEGGLLCLYECVVSGVLLQLRKIPKRASSVFPSQPCRKDSPALEENPIDASSSCRLQWKEKDEESVRKRLVSLYKKDGVNGVFLLYLAFVFLPFSRFGLAMFGGIFDWCFLLSSFRLVQSILVSSNSCLYIIVVILYFGTLLFCVMG